MNTIWSEHIQGTETLYYSRKNRFSDAFRSQYKALFRLSDAESIDVLEIGCGPGALMESLARWYPKASLTGLDRDSTFIEFAKKRLPDAKLVEGDATALPFRDGCFDVALSNTVSEHIEPSGFFGEQRRVLKSGGICLVLSARKGFSVAADCLGEDGMERAFWEKASKYDSSFQDYAVCRYPLNPAELPKTMEQYGFTDVSTGYVILDFTPDDSKYPRDFAREMILSEYRAQRESLAAVERDHKSRFTQEEFDAMRQHIDEKYQERLRLLECGERQWDTQVCVTQVVRGIKR